MTKTGPPLVCDELLENPDTPPSSLDRRDDQSIPSRSSR